MLFYLYLSILLIPKYSQSYLCLNIIIINIITIIVGIFLIQKSIITSDRKLLAIILICTFGS